MDRRTFLLATGFSTLPPVRAKTWIIPRRNGQFCAYCKEAFNGDEELVRVWRYNDNWLYCSKAHALIGKKRANG